MKRLLIHVQYLKGIGHLQRAKLIAEAAAAQGLDVHIVSGGLPVPGFDPDGATLHQLPALQAGPGGFTDLRDAEGCRVDDAWRAARRDKLLKSFAKLAPDILLIESFPFGRRALSFELIPLLETAHARAAPPTVFCSIRDILQTNRKPGRAEETVSRLRACFDGVLVHGDPRFAPLEETFPKAPEIKDLIRYTGFVAAPETVFEAEKDTPRGEVVVSAGGGAIGPALFDAALAARPNTVFRDTPWRLITGPHLGDKDFNRLYDTAPDGVAVERFRNDFRALLSSSTLSISYAGYNTVADLLRARVRSVLVTYGGPEGRETEQAMRAERLCRHGLTSALSDSEITADRLSKAVDDAAALPPLPECDFDLDGAGNTAKLLIGLEATAATGASC
jgi:predicted glycosyltransferase